MNADDKMEEGSSPENDPELKWLDRALSRFPDLVFPPPADLQEASDEKVAELMQRTAAVRSARRFRLIRNPRAVLALAASVSILMAGGFWFSSMRDRQSGFVVALAFSQGPSIAQYAFRGGDSTEVDLSKAVESGVQKGLMGHSKADDVLVLHVDSTELPDHSEESLASLAKTMESRRVLFVTQDPETGDFMLTVFDRKSERICEEERLDSWEASALEAEVSQWISEWMRSGVLRRK